jgi:hypothetical protein
MIKMMTEMRDRMKARVGIYSTGWEPSSVMGLLLPIIASLLLILFGYLLVEALHSMA